jgi:penicillin-binding protein 1A
VVNPKRAKLRQLYVLRRMNALHFITDKEFTAAGVEPIVIRRASQIFPVKADYFIEMVRQEIFQKYQDATYTQGLKVYTTLRLKDQQAAYLSLRKGVLDYDHRHGYRGPEGFTDLKKNNNDEALEEVLQDATDNDDLLPAVVLSANSHEVQAYCKGGERVTISDEGLRFAHRSLTDKAALNQRIIAGSIIRVQKTDQDTWQISQLPQVEAAFVSGDPQTGAIYSMVGGFDYNQNKFNHVTQAWRQPGSSFKPFLYSASLEKGFTPATIINDAPLSFGSDQTGSDPWQPKNYDGKYDGPMRMREALIHSKNMVSIRILQSITPQYAQEYISKFGLDKDKIPPYLTMALGAGSVTALQMLTGYSVFANGGFRVEPYYIQHVEDANGKVLSQTAPITTETGAPSVIDVRNAYTMVSMMQDVVKHGTGFRAMQLGRQDLAGKTGTTNDSIDAWFCGFQPTVVGIAWIGFDQPRSLGDKETGGGAALPIWMGYMGKVLQGIPEAKYTMPDGMVALRINDQGHRDENGKRTEYFYKENLPQTQDTTTIPGADIPLEGSKDAIKDQLL